MHQIGIGCRKEKEKRKQTFSQSSKTFYINIISTSSISVMSEAVVGRCFVKKVFLEILQNSQENTCANLFFKKENFIKKETLAQVFSSEFCKISKNNFFTEHPRTTASASINDNIYLLSLEQFVKVEIIKF